jgi:hypothetical protein
MKKQRRLPLALVTILLLTTLLPLKAQQMTKANLYVKVELHNEVYEPEIVSCGTSEVAFHISKRKVIIIAKQVTLDLKVKKKRIGDYKSWKAIDKDKQYYYITPFQEDQIFGLYIQPISKNFDKMYDRPVVIVSNGSICR